MDGLDRLTQAEEGTWSGSAISSATRDELWSLDHLGNWAGHQLDLNGDADYVDTDELDEDRTHNEVNELLTRDLDGGGSTDETLAYNAVGELTDDGADWKFEYDAFGRLREVTDQSSGRVAEYRYNGLGYQIAEHIDTDTDGDVDGSDLWYYSAFDERWRKLSTYRSTDTDPKEDFIPHQAGLDGHGGSSYINDTILRDKDASTAWTAAADGVPDERTFYLNNWRGDVVAMVKSVPYQSEMVRYSAYGVPFAYPGGDCDADGDADAADRTVILNWISTSAYDVRGDLNLDGVVNSTDTTLHSNAYTGVSLGRGALSSRGNRIGYAGIAWNGQDRWLARHRWHDPERGKWGRRDPLDYADGMSLYATLRSRPTNGVDPHGLLSLERNASGSFSSGGYYEFTPDPVPLGDPPPRTGKSCCDTTKSDAAADQAVGWVACCDGHKQTCYSEDHFPDGSEPTNQGAKKIIEKCVKQHEGTHLNDVECEPGVVERPDYLHPENAYGEEGVGFNEETNCLFGALNSDACNGDEQCESELRDRIADLVVAYDQLYGELQELGWIPYGTPQTPLSYPDWHPEGEGDITFPIEYPPFSN
jgi:RHS repeat-associated protein